MKAKPLAPDQEQVQVQLQWKPGAVALLLPEPKQWIGFTPEQAIAVGLELAAMGRLAGKQVS